MAFGDDFRDDATRWMSTGLVLGGFGYAGYRGYRDYGASRFSKTSDLVSSMTNPAM
jgi:hypothetical protein